MHIFFGFVFSLLLLSFHVYRFPVSKIEPCYFFLVISSWHFTVATLYPCKSILKYHICFHAAWHHWRGRKRHGNDVRSNTRYMSHGEGWRVFFLQFIMLHVFFSSLNDLERQITQVSEGLEVPQISHRRSWENNCRTGINAQHTWVRCCAVSWSGSNPPKAHLCSPSSLIPSTSCGKKDHGQKQEEGDGDGGGGGDSQSTILTQGLEKKIPTIALLEPLSHLSRLGSAEGTY